MSVWQDECFHAEEASERRRHSRIPAAGPVTITVQDARRLEVYGTLVDISAGGFRVAHRSTALASGDTVAYQHEDGTGLARVVWNRVTPETVETGFYILSGC